MAFALLIYEDRDRRGRRTAAEARNEAEQMTAFADDLHARGLLQGGESLKPERVGKRITTRRGRTMVLGGPFPGSGEVVGGLFLIDCDEEDDALAIARACPAATWATVELRELGSDYDE